MVKSSQGLARFHLLKEKLLDLPTVETEPKGVRSYEKKVKEAFQFVPAREWITGSLILYEDGSAEIFISAPPLGVDFFNEVSNDQLDKSPFEILSEDLCMPGERVIAFAQKSAYDKAYLKLLHFYKWILKEKCKISGVTYDKEPLSKEEKDKVLDYFRK